MKLKVAAFWIVLQAVFFVVWAQTEEGRFAEGEGQSILVETLPVDPRDLLRGQYMRLGYTFSRPSEFGIDMSEVSQGAQIWIVMEEKGKFHEPVRSAKDRPDHLGPNEVALRGRWDGWNLDTGVERFYVEEGTPTPRGNDITVRLRVAENGSLRIEQIYAGGREWP